MTAAIWWIRRDLRLVDNQALQAALRSAGQVIPVFILDDALLSSPYASEKRSAFLYEGLRRLDQSLSQRGARLVVRRGEPVRTLISLLQESGAQAVFAEPDYSPYAQSRDRRAGDTLPIQWAGSPAVRPPGSVLTANGSPYTVFTPFSKAWKALPGVDGGAGFSAPDRIPTLEGLASLPIPDSTAWPASQLFPAGEEQAQSRLERFSGHLASGAPPSLLYQYSSGRNQLDLDGTSGLSPYLRFGMLSARQAVARALQAIQAAQDSVARQSAETWLNELIWREFYIHILYHFPHVRKGNFRLGNIRWENNRAHFETWCAGQTGYPIVDAAMRQLIATGWIHNRARMIVASFLTKDLLIDWRWGERFFMQHLLDGDPAANNGGWQWTAGTGTDAAPYFRIFNPILQSLKHDPQGNFIRRWLPELSAVPGEFIHEPWKMPADLQVSCGCRIGRDYPEPLVDHALARQRTLQAYNPS